MAEWEGKDVPFTRSERDEEEYPIELSMRPHNSPLLKRQQWMVDVDEDNFKILDPDDPLMKRFQDALKAHLLRLDKKLDDEIYELEAAIKDEAKTREEEGVALYEIQQEAARQESAIENYRDMLAEVINLRGDVEERLRKVKETHKKVSDELETKKLKERKLVASVESLSQLQRQFSKWESELDGSVTISQRISEKDAAVQKDLLYQKQQKDFILYKLEDEVWRLQSEIKDLDEQLQIKDQEKMTLGQTIADANADLEGLEKEHKTLYAAWNSVINLIGQRDKINEEIGVEQRKIRESLQNLQTQVEKLKKDSTSEMENNERLTALQTRINAEIKLTKRLYDEDYGKYSNLELNVAKISKLMEQSQLQFDIANAEFECVSNEEKAIDKELAKFESQKYEIEDSILAKLDDKITHDNAVRYLNKLLHEAKDFNLQSELTLTKTENQYGKLLLETEKLTSTLDNEKFELDNMVSRNSEKQQEIDKLLMDMRNLELLWKQKERKVAQLNKKIDEILEANGRQEANPLDIKIKAMERNIDETEGKMKKAQQLWLRQQSNVFNLSKQRHLQMQELSVIGKEIIIMEQKNLKLEIDMEKARKEEANLSRTMSALQQKLLQMNLHLSSQKELKNELEDKNNVTKTEYMQSLEDSEMELMRLQNDIKKLSDEKVCLKEELKCSQQESLSWEKKVQMASETNKSYKEERNAGGDIATMKSEIHKMEIRLSYLRKAQEKLVQDMEFCISRRDNIIDEALAKEKIIPRNQHNQKIVMRKRLDDQRTKIKHLVKETKQMENKITSVQDEQKKLLDYLNEGQKLLRLNEDIIPDTEKQIQEAELIKHHNLEVLVRKQRKVNMLQDLKNGKYKPILKNEMTLNEEWRNQQDLNNNLKEVMQQTQHDFPLLNCQVKKILLTLQN
ncbi:hypothetical protein QAD02_018970 [Eretmocerus hayati]|uniref:Uncharacterized protein n=1 Tax=Eretmocerus hayati TaxID=131215 RepID=A0ACC2PJC2_9HYME|nr:hypothetical protein QAD02_018970 [Eretmocerus hayati]